MHAIATMARDPAVGEPPQNRKHAFELRLAKVCFDGLCPKVSALPSSNVWMLVTVRLSKQTQLQGSIKIDSKNLLANTCIAILLAARMESRLLAARH